MLTYIRQLTDILICIYIKKRQREIIKEQSISENGRWRVGGRRESRRGKSGKRKGEEERRRGRDVEGGKINSSQVHVA